MNIRKVFRAVLFIVLPILFLSLILLKPVSTNPGISDEFLTRSLDSLHAATVVSSFPGEKLFTSFRKLEIQPDGSMPMAGYSPRSSYDSIHDPVEVRLGLFSSSGINVFMISADLLIFPPFLRDKIESELGPNDRIYLSASHTHSSLGSWDPNFGGQIAAGKFNETFWSDMSDKILKTMREMKSSALPTNLSYFETPAPFVKNRLSPGDPVDDLIRGITLHRNNGDSVILFTYSGHPTVISRKLKIISGDYPGMVTRKLEASGYSFSMFLAGMMGSHRVTGIPGENFERSEALADSIVTRILSSRMDSSSSSALAYSTFNLSLDESRMRISSGIAIRDWVFRNALGPLEGHLTALRIGDITFVSTPCDFSGELWARERISVPENTHVIITSFNGDYIGYITEDSHYQSCNHAEVRTMNWSGQLGQAMSTLVQKTVEKLN